MDIFIKKVIVDCEIADYDVADFSPSAQVSHEPENLLKKQILPLLDEVIEEMVSDAWYLSLNKLSLQLEFNGIGNSSATVNAGIIRKALKRELTKVLTNNTDLRPESDAVWEQFIFIVTRGYTPWTFGYKKHKEFEEALVASTPTQGMRHRILNEALGNLNCLQRISNIYSLSFEIKLLQILFGNIPYSEDKIKADIDKIASDLTHADNGIISYIFLILGIYSFGSGNELFSRIPESAGQRFKALVETFQAGGRQMPKLEIKEFQATLHKLLEKRSDAVSVNNDEDKVRKDDLRPWEHDGVEIENAGLVILANFLPDFFKRLDLLKDAQLTNSHRCVYLLQLLSGAPNDEEYNLFLNKILCGLEPEEILNRPKKFRKKDMEECEMLLKTVIEYWSALKSTSRETMQRSFFQRSGKIYKQDDVLFLKVEEKAEDVLLEHLPWSISMIKLPWMKYMLSVNWMSKNAGW